MYLFGSDQRHSTELFGEDRLAESWAVFGGISVLGVTSRSCPWDVAVGG